MSRVFATLIFCLFIASIVISGGVHDALAGNNIAIQEPKPQPVYKSEVIGKDTTVYFNAEVMPVFPGGDRALIRYLANAAYYPRIAGSGHVEGQVVVRFVVFADCSVGKAEIIKSVARDLDQDALRVVREMPNWESPGMIDGEPVNVYYIVPVRYKLEF